MIMSLFRKDQIRPRAVSLYEAAVAQARRPALYLDYGAPDTVEGRFEQITLHVYLILRVLKGPDREAKALRQGLFDVMFQNMDDSLRELGVGDLSVGKKIRKLAENFYGRIKAYEKSFSDNESADTLAKALGRNIYENEDAEAAVRLAGYVRDAAAMVDAQPLPAILAGNVQFPALEQAA